MKVKVDCLPCVGRQALETARRATSDEAVVERAMRQALTGPFDVTPAEFSMAAYRAVADVTGVADPYALEKREHNAAAMSLLPALREALAASPDRLAAAVAAAIAGNTIDLGIGMRFDLDELAGRALSIPLGRDDTPVLKKALSRARSVLYVADNAGEIAFDRLLIEEMGPERVTVAVKEGPIINDATMEDARAVGLTEICRVITTGCDWIGAPLPRVGREFARALSDAEVVISKGQGNFETLDDWAGPIFFLLLAKCPCVAGELGVRLGEAVVAASPIAARPTSRRR